MRSHLTRKVRSALSSLKVVIRPKVVDGGVECYGVYYRHRGVVELSASACTDPDKLVLTVLHEVAHHLFDGLPEYAIDGALDKALAMSPTLKYEAAKKLIEVLMKPRWDRCRSSK